MSVRSCACGMRAMVDAIEQDSSVRGVVEALDEVDKYALARSRRPDERIGLARLELEAYAIERRLLCTLEGESDVLEAHGVRPVGSGSLDAHGIIGIMDGRLALQDGRDALGSGLGAWPDHEDHREHHDRHEQQHGVLDDRHQIARLETSQVDQLRANPGDDDDHEVQHETDKRHEHRHAACHGDVGIGEHLVGDRKAPLLEAFLVVRPDDADTREALTRDAIEVVDASPAGTAGAGR